eukprot:scaffold31695_cov118-Isochrysis_galbana.AAC.6
MKEGGGPCSSWQESSRRWHHVTSTVNACARHARSAPPNASATAALRPRSARNYGSDTDCCDR